MKKKKTFLEFFAGIGLVHLGLKGSGWTCAYANDISTKKMEMYLDEFPGAEYYHCENVWNTSEITNRIKNPALLATASFPCTDLSLAGKMKGLDGKHSGTLFGFINVLKSLKITDSLPKMVLIENVPGLLTGSGGKDFKNTCRAVAELGYYLDSFIVDAKYFIPQSRSRLFIVGVLEDSLPPTVTRKDDFLWETRLLERTATSNGKLRQAVEETEVETGWIAFDLPKLVLSQLPLTDIIDTDEGQLWWTEEEVQRHILRMSDAHRRKIELLAETETIWTGTAFRRIREGTTRVEVRFDGLAGCLRTANGGSARQIVLLVKDKQIKMRWMSPREYARLQGAPEFTITRGINQSLTGFGDGVCVPVIEWIDNHVLSVIAAHLEHEENGIPHYHPALHKNQRMKCRSDKREYK